MKVRLFGTLRSAVGGSKEIEVHVGGRRTARQLLDQLILSYPGLAQKALAQSGELQAGMNLLVNGRSVRFLNGLDTLLHEDDEVALFPPLGGGEQ